MFDLGGISTPRESSEESWTYRPAAEPDSSAEGGL